MIVLYFALLGTDIPLSETFEDYTCVFRVPFRQHLITDTTYFNYGQTDVCKAKFFILDLNGMPPTSPSDFLYSYLPID